MTTKTIVLVRPHRHEGVIKQPGSEITVSEKLASWLIGQGTARDKGSAKAPQQPALLHRPCCGRR